MGKMNPEDVEVNVLYIMAHAMELLVRDVDRTLRRKGERFRHEKKRQFTRFAELVKGVCLTGELISADVETTTAGRAKDYDQFGKEANELCRLMLLYADRSNSDGNVSKVFDYLRSLKGEGIITDEFLTKYVLK